MYIYVYIYTHIQRAVAVVFFRDPSAQRIKNPYCFCFKCGFTTVSSCTLPFYEDYSLWCTPTTNIKKYFYWWSHVQAILLTRQIVQVSARLRPWKSVDTCKTSWASHRIKKTAYLTVLWIESEQIGKQMHICFRIFLN